jgi:hypothetical protein
MHFIRPDKSILSCFVSEYAVGNYSWLMILGFLGMAVGALCLIIGLLNSLEASKTGIITLVLWCGCTFLFSIFVTDIPGDRPTPQGLIHGFAALIALLNLSITMLAWGHIFNRNGSWRNMAKTSLFFGVVSIAIFIAFLLSPPSIRGLTERILIILDISWVILVNRQLVVLLTPIQHYET